MEEAEILEVVDHHRVGTLETPGPIFYRLQPVGCTCTIIYEMFQENGIEIPANIAGLMMSAILSDTLCFRSPTCTPRDVYVGKKLAEICGEDPDVYSDAMFDAILSASVLASAVVYLIWGVSLEAYVGVVISLVIIKAGVEMMIETLNDIIGQRGDAEMSKQIKRLVNEEPEVRGAYDLNLFNYGPDKYYGSVHMELPDTMTVDEVDVLTRKIQLKVYQETGVILTGIGVYSYNTSNDEAAEIRNTVQHTILSHDWALQMHGFYVDTINKTMRFDVVVSFDIDHKEALDIMTGEVKKLYPDYDVQIIPDVDVTD
jgi:hypothetical protein